MPTGIVSGVNESPFSLYHVLSGSSFPAVNPLPRLIRLSEEHPLNMPLMRLTLEVFKVDKSKDASEEHPLNM